MKSHVLWIIFALTTGLGFQVYAQTEEPANPQAQTQVGLPVQTQVGLPVQTQVGLPTDAQVEPATAPVANSKGLDESSLSNDKGLDDYRRPLLFAPEDNGLQPDNPQIKWEMDSTGRAINMGGLRLNSSLISVKIETIPRASAPIDIRSVKINSPTVTILSFSWPTLLTNDGTFTIESANKKVSFSETVTEDSRADWRKRLARYKTSYLRYDQNSRWGITDLPAKALYPYRKGAPFRVCMSKINSDLEKLKICTPLQSLVQPITETSVATVFLRDKPIGKAGLINTPLGNEVRLKILFADGAQIEISSQPAALDLLDVVESKDGREIILTGRLAQPLGKKKIIERPSMHFWAPSGIQQDTVWQIALPKDAPTLRILGAFHLPFTFLFRYEKLPTENDRVFIREAASQGSYSQTPVLFGYSPKSRQIESQEVSARKTDDHHFTWDFSAPEKGARNRSRLTLLSQNDVSSRQWIAHHSLYRGYPFEASARLAGVLGSTGQLIVLGEVASSVWLETIGFENDLLSRQRWGLTARYFRTLTAIQSTTGASVSDLSTINADLKYNLVRGIWNHDRLFGIMGSIERVTIAGLKSNLVGGGIYWARTLPKVFSDFFDQFSVLDESKYVDVEFIYYPVAASGQITTSNSFNLNFHGKIFWAPRLYGEAGFGVHQYGFSDVSQNAQIAFSTVYGNVGMGFIF